MVGVAHAVVDQLVDMGRGNKEGGGREEREGGEGERERGGLTLLARSSSNSPQERKKSWLVM